MERYSMRWIGWFPCAFWPNLDGDHLLHLVDNVAVAPDVDLRRLGEDILKLRDKRRVAPDRPISDWTSCATLKW